MGRVSCLPSCVLVGSPEGWIGFLFFLLLLLDPPLVSPDLADLACSPPRACMVCAGSQEGQIGFLFLLLLPGLPWLLQTHGKGRFDLFFQNPNSCIRSQEGQIGFWFLLLLTSPSMATPFRVLNIDPFLFISKIILHCRLLFIWYQLCKFCLDLFKHQACI